MPRSILKMQSPTGVADFLQVDSNKMQKDLDTSFSWTECPIAVDPSVPKSCLSWGRGPNKRMAQMEQRLQWLQDQRAKDKQDYQHQLAQAQEQARQDFLQRHGQDLNVHHRNYDVQVSETSKIINYLKQDNARIRDEIKGLKRNMQRLHQQNKELEQANASVQNSYQDLEHHMEGLQTVNFKLTENSKVFKDTLAKMKGDLKKRIQYHQMEDKTVTKYEACLAKVLAQVQQYVASPASKTTAALEQQVHTMTADSAEEIGNGRQAYLTKVGLSMEEKQRRQLDRLQHPDLLVAWHKTAQRRGAQDGSDTDDSDTDDSDEEEDSDYEAASSDDN